MSEIPLLVEFVRGTSLYHEGDLVSDFPILQNGPPGTFVMFPDGVRVSLPTDQIVHSDDERGAARVGFGGMSFAGMEAAGLTFYRTRELHPEEELSPDRSHTMILNPAWVASIAVAGRQVWPAGS